MADLRTAEPLSAGDAPGEPVVRPARTVVAEYSPGKSAETDAAELIIRRIREETHGGVRDLEVRVDADRVRLLGRCATYYTKQRAQHAAMTAAHETGADADIENEIQVW